MQQNDSLVNGSATLPSACIPSAVVPCRFTVFSSLPQIGAVILVEFVDRCHEGIVKYHIHNEKSFVCEIAFP